MAFEKIKNNDGNKKSKRTSQRDYLPSSVKRRSVGGVLVNTTTATSTSSLTYYAEDMRYEDSTTYTIDENDGFLVTVTPRSKIPVMVQMYVTLTVDSAVHESKIDSDLRAGTETNSATWDDAVVEWGKDASNQVLSAGFTFRRVFVPAGATITSAYLILIAKGTKTATVNGKIYGTSDGYAGTFSSSTRPSTITKTTANVDWDTTSQTDGAVMTSPDVSSIITEILAHADWSSSGRIQLQITDDGSASGKFVSIQDFTDTSAASEDVYLQINYTSSGLDADTPLNVTIMPQLSASSNSTGVRAFAVFAKLRGYEFDGFQNETRQSTINYTLTFRGDVISTGAT